MNWWVLVPPVALFGLMVRYAIASRERRPVVVCVACGYTGPVEVGAMFGTHGYRCALCADQTLRSSVAWDRRWR